MSERRQFRDTGSAPASTARSTPPIGNPTRSIYDGAATSARRTGGGSTSSTGSPSRRLPKVARRSACTPSTRSRRGARRSRTQRWRTSRQSARTGTSGGRPSTRRCGRPTRTGRPCSRRSCSPLDGVVHATAPARWRRRRAAFCCFVIILAYSSGRRTGRWSRRVLSTRRTPWLACAVPTEYVESGGRLSRPIY